MSKNTCFSVIVSVVAVAMLAIAWHYGAQAQRHSTAVADPTLLMFIRGYTGNSDDLEHCFVRDEDSKKRPLFFNVYTDGNCLAS